MAHLEWYLADLQTIVTETIANGLKQCHISLCASDDPLPPFKLPVSSHASETLKGVVCRTGASVTASDIQLKLHSLKSKSFSARIKKNDGYPLSQIDACINHVQGALDECVSIVGTSDATQILLAAESLIYHVNEAVGAINSPVVLMDKPSQSSMAGVESGTLSNSESRCSTPNPHVSHSSQAIQVTLNQSLPGSTPGAPVGAPLWLFPNTPPATCFSPVLPPELVVEFYIARCAIVVDVHVLEKSHGRAGSASIDPSPSSSSANLNSLTNLFKRNSVAVHHNAPKILYNGEYYSEIERVVVDTKDPILMSIEAKLSVIKSAAYRMHRNLTSLVGGNDSDQMASGVVSEVSEIVVG